jgi:L-lactate permease
MLVGLGLPPLHAAAVCLIADTAPVAFGAIAIPITTLGEVTGLPTHNLAQMVGRQTPFLALIVPFVLVFVIDGRRGAPRSYLPPSGRLEHLPRPDHGRDRAPAVNRGAVLDGPLTPDRQRCASRPGAHRLGYSRYS